MSDWAREKVEVNLLTALYAIRYGMGRMTYANNDAAELAHRVWNRLPLTIRYQVFDEATRVKGIEKPPWAWLLANGPGLLSDGESDE